MSSLRELIQKLSETTDYVEEDGTPDGTGYSLQSRIAFEALGRDGVIKIADLLDRAMAELAKWHEWRICEDEGHPAAVLLAEFHALFPAAVPEEKTTT